MHFNTHAKLMFGCTYVLYSVQTDLCHLPPVVSGAVLDLSQHLLIAMYGT